MKLITNTNLEKFFLSARIKKFARVSAPVKTAKRARGIKIANYRDGPRVRPGNKIEIYTMHRLLVRQQFLTLTAAIYARITF